jgi:hypothetical protein
MPDQDESSQPKKVFLSHGRKEALVNTFVKALANVTLATSGVPSTFTFDKESSEKTKVSLREEQLRLLQNLSSTGIDPRLFDLMLSNELDRNLKRQFGVAFFFSNNFLHAAVLWGNYI